MPEIIDWRLAATPDEIVQRVARVLDQGATVVLPTEAGYVLAADPDKLANPMRPSGIPEGINVFRTDAYFGAGDFLERYADASATEQSLAYRIWPGPVGWIHMDSPFPAWVPMHQAAGTILAGRRGPLAMFEINGGETIEPASLGELLVLTDGISRSGPISLLRVTDRRWTMLRVGVRSESEITEALARRILFVCTGNTCRSPMAAEMFRSRLTQILGCRAIELIGRGFSIASAGLAAIPGDPATPESRLAARQLGVELSTHRSQSATVDMIARADDIVAMTRSHLLTLVNRYPIISGTMRLLCGMEGDLSDPIGGGPEVYRACAESIHRNVDRLLTEMGLS